ncbi:suppressor of lurcher protein 1-like [Schistocerca gregaria]|uniref:suppressor of lurcher protein 1-like n=1 Tax=Schistocerca gregaria TaxID=7010 RepID=UPI00211E235E|nr:suppressor of lurcher protein 1-like [Schistocerca gregaria]
MEIRFLLELLLPFLFASGVAVNPGCECLLFTSTFGKEFGVFSSPDYPRPYPSDVDCLLYSFVGGSYDIVHITFVDFDVQKTHLDCSLGDRVEVFLSLGGQLRADVNERTPPAGVLCGGLRDVPAALYSQGPALVLAMHAAGPPSNSSGFLGRFRFLDRRSFRSDGRRVLGTECDQLFSSGDGPRSGRFFSPRYPSSYPSNTTCKYYFRAREKERIRLVFEEVSLQKRDASCLESEDTVTIHDGASPASPSSAVVCAEASQLEVLSTGSHLYVELSARARWPAQGFRATFHFQEGPEGQGGAARDAAEPVTAQCGATISSDGARSGAVGAPADRAAHARCRFDFEARGRQRVRLLLGGVQSPAERARCDSAETASVYVWTDGRVEQLWSGCAAGSEQQQLMASGPRMRIEFHGKRPDTTLSLVARYSFVSDFGVIAPRGRQLSSWPCAFSFNGSEAARGYVTSPNFPGLYPRDTECHFFFHGRPGQRIALRFVHFDVEGVQPCEALSASDYVEMSNYRGRDSRFSRYCGQLEPFDVLSDGKYFRLTFKSNGRLDATGFNVTYRFLGGNRDASLARRSQTGRAAGTTSLWPLIVFCLKFVC